MLDEALVDKIAARVLALLSGEPIDSSPRNVLMLFSGTSTGFVAGMEAIRRLSGSGHSLTVVLTPAASHIITEAQACQAGARDIIGPGEWANAPGLVKQSDLLLVPTLSMNLAARLALGLMDSLISTLVVGALLAGKAVVAIRDGADPNGSAGQVFGAAGESAPALRARLEGHLTTLASYGVELVSEGEFLVTLERRLITRVAPLAAARQAAARQSGTIGQASSEAVAHRNGTGTSFITAAELLSFQPGSVVRLAPGSRLTPQAWDTAARLNLKLQCE
jgi:flavoprotein